MDVTVIGGGPAGSVAALLLAQRGHRVALIEQHRFPRDKVCGECLNVMGVDVLARSGIWQRVKALGPIELPCVVLHAPDGSSVEIALVRPVWGIPRRTMDTALLATAEAAGVVPVQPARCEGIVFADAGSLSAIRVRHLETNRLYTYRSRFIIVADGKGALLPNRRPSSGDLGVKAHFHNIDGPRNAVELFGVNGHYGGIAVVEPDQWNIAFNVPAWRVAESRGDLDAMFGTIVSENRTLARRMKSAVRCGAWVTSNLPRFPVAAHWPAKVIPIGNAAAALEPIGGEGMGLALLSAELAAIEVDAAIRSRRPFDADSLRRRFDRLWRPRRLACRAIALAMSRPPVAEAFVPAAAACSRLTQSVIRWIAGAGLPAGFSAAAPLAADESS
jgi:flavin-dependent dehydrogenase